MGHLTLLHKILSNLIKEVKELTGSQNPADVEATYREKNEIQLKYSLSSFCKAF
jgi:hypothetical protein